MPNVTISVPEKLKAEMEMIPEVSWSEVCRNAISQYIAQRKNPTPKIELDLRHSRIDHEDFLTGYPTLSLDLKIMNKMDAEIMVDRVVANARFFRTDDNRVFAIGVANDLYRKIIGPNSSGGSTIRLILPKEKIRDLKGEFKSTFDCHVSCMVYVEGFRSGYNQEVKARVPIDHWNNIVAKVLKKSQTD